MREVVKHNVIERDKILVPSNWDSWGKIRILREGFELETVGDAWSVEIQTPPEELEKLEQVVGKNAENENETNARTDTVPSASAVSIFESVLPDPALEKSYQPLTDLDEEVTAPDTQTFFGQQVKVLEQLRGEDEKSGRRNRRGAPAPTGGTHGDFEDNLQMNDQIGPYQINIGGIQVDAEEVTKRLQAREASRSRGGMESPRKDGGATPSGVEGSETIKGSNEVYKDFFASLIKKGKGGTGDASPRGSPSRPLDR